MIAIKAYKKIIGLLYLAALITNNAMAMKRQYPNNVCLKKEQNNNINDINLLLQLPLELIEKIMDFLPIGDLGYKYLRLYSKLPMTQKQAEYAINKFYKKELLLCQNLTKFINKITAHYNNLDGSFPDYNVLEKAYKCVLSVQKCKLLQSTENIINKIQTNIEPSWLENKEDLKKLIDITKSLYIEKNFDKLNTDPQNQIKLIINTNIILIKIKHYCNHIKSKINFVDDYRSTLYIGSILFLFSCYILWTYNSPEHLNNKVSLLLIVHTISILRIKWFVDLFLNVDAILKIGNKQSDLFDLVAIKLIRLQKTLSKFEHIDYKKAV